MKIIKSHRQIAEKVYSIPIKFFRRSKGCPEWI